MSSSANEPGIDRPPATSDLTTAPDADAITPVTTIGKFKVPTDVLRAYTMVFALIAIWIISTFQQTTSFSSRETFPTSCGKLRSQVCSP